MHTCTTASPMPQASLSSFMQELGYIQTGHSYNTQLAKAIVLYYRMCKKALGEIMNLHVLPHLPTQNLIIIGDICLVESDES